MGFPPTVGLRVLLQDAKGDLLKTTFLTPNLIGEENKH